MKTKLNFFCNKYAITLLLFCTVSIIYSSELNIKKAEQNQLLILPLGNSITYDNRTNDSRNVGEKDGYRGPLYSMLKSAGFNFDFIGSEHSGGNYLPAGYDENAGFPGITDDQLLYLLQTGHLFIPNQGVDRQVTAGAYLNTYSPDVILLHIGTNNNDLEDGTSPLDVEQILDQIDQFENEAGKEVTVFLARIIDRVPAQSYVKTFNDNITQMAMDRMNNPANDAFPDNIVIVDMQDSANLVYNISPEPDMNSGDMNDALHPNNNGYQKMAARWFKAIKENLPNPPIITMQPGDQFIVEDGTAEFSVSTESESPVLYQWRKNGVNIPLATSQTLRIANVSMSNNGAHYSCLMTNINGSVESKDAILYISSKSERVQKSIVAEYDFEEGEGNIIHNVQEVSENLDLSVATTDNIDWIQHGINIHANANISTQISATSIIDSLRSSNQFTIEIWLSIDQINQIGPARIFTISANDSERNISIDQNYDSLVFRTRTTETDNDGSPEFASDNLIFENTLLQVVLTRNSEGLEKFYLDGTFLKAFEKGGDLSNWNNDYKLSLGNELFGDQPWIGSLFHLAIYNRELSPDEIVHNYSFGEFGITDIDYEKYILTSYYQISQNYPNPFNPTTNIQFGIPEVSEVSINVYNMLGEVVAELVNSKYSPGYHSISFNAQNFPSGVYVYSIKANGISGKSFVQTRKMLLLK